ncbi:gliding motility-associated ABC transporter substrate-binding protein GldG [Chitinophagaceae bacterium IBVUCB1]|nr:gliding motility-associated ABC transporter substrate-binding protein GldG [Chitinophagaceae bacterium IBVUCB1]
MSKLNTNKRKSQVRLAIIRLLMLVAILIGINILAARFHTGIDLTKEKRFTLSQPTKNMLSSMKDVAVFTVYLKGNFPAGYQRLAEATREKLESFRSVAGKKIIYRFVNPFEGKSEEEKVLISKELAEKGIYGVNLKIADESEGYSEKWVFPYVLVQYKNSETSVNLYDEVQWMNTWENLIKSENQLEYKLASAINRLDQPAKPEIAYIVGHGESLGIQTYDLLQSLGVQYKVDTFDLTTNYYIPKSYKAIIINRPTTPIDDREKFKIDQYVMEGGKVLWAIDQLYTPMDSLNKSQQFMTLDYGLELDDMLFKYGVRVNLDVIEDLQCLQLPIIVGAQSGKPQMQLRPWMFYPIFAPAGQHPIVKNLSGIFGRFASSIDTVANPEVKKTILLQSSKYSRVEAFPVRVSLSVLNYPLPPDMFTKPYQSSAVLLEGKFRSAFENRLAPGFIKLLEDSLKRKFRTVSDTATSMIVVSDGEMFENDFSQSQGIMEMGYWKFTQTRFENKEFLLNCIEYLTDNTGLLEARVKDLKLRMLDRKRVKDEKAKWRVINIGVPIALILVFASAYMFFRKRRYEKKAV